MSQDPVIWEGILSAFPSEKPAQIFESDRWLARTSESVEASINGLRAGDWQRSLVHEYPLAPCVATLQGFVKGPIRILDFGGGMASSYIPLRASLPSLPIEFDIVESAIVCKSGQDVFKGSEVRFFEELPQESTYHIVHAGASLHYVEDWKGMLDRFASLASRQIILSGLTAGDQIPTFVTWQLYYGSRVPVWFWNLNEVVAHLAAAGWKLTYRSLLASEYRGTIQALPMNNFPQTHRLERKCNLIFSRDDHV